MAYRNKTYVAFDGDNDMRYYTLMLAWKQNDNTNFNFFNAHDINTARDSSTEETIKRALSERMNNSKVFVLLVGQNTRYLTKYVKWEVELALKKRLPIIVVNLNKIKHKDESLCPCWLDNKLAIHISYENKIMQYTLEKWEFYHNEYVNDNTKNQQHYYWQEEIYNKL